MMKNWLNSIKEFKAKKKTEITDILLEAELYEKNHIITAAKPMNNFYMSEQPGGFARAQQNIH